MLPPISEEVLRLVRSLFETRSLWDRVRRHDQRVATLDAIADAREFRVVPDLLPLLATSDAVGRHVGRVVAGLVEGVTPAQLSWLDEQVRRGSQPLSWSSAWLAIAPAAVSRLAQRHELDATVIGLLASHPHGFVRAAALDVLARHTGGREIPFLALRVNDWVAPVAARATELLIDRLRPDNRHAVLDALPSVVRVLGQRRRDQGGVARALTSALVSDGVEDALARATQLDPPVRRAMYELLMAGGTASRRRLLRAALDDPDAVIRVRTIQCAATDPELDDRAAILERFLRDDRVPAVRRVALAVLAEHVPEGLAGLFPEVLLDRSARVRGLAQVLAGTHQLVPTPRTVYVDALAGSVPTRTVVALAGVGETGNRADADLVAPFLSANRPRIRRSALRALARLDPERAVAAATGALADEAATVRSAAVGILADNARRVDFDTVWAAVRPLPDPQVRGNLLRVFRWARKWDALALLLEALTDADDRVRTVAASLVGGWTADFNRDQTQPTTKQLQRIGALIDTVASRMPEETARPLRFSIETCAATLPGRRRAEP